MENKELKHIANFLFEAGILQKTPRSGFYFLGSGSQSVAEHLNRVGYIGFALAKMHGGADVAKVLEMCMFHDFMESRISDLGHLHQKYTDRHEDKALHDLAATLPFGEDIKTIVEEYEKRETIESVITKDADNLELLLSVKEQVDVGNERALSWVPSCVKRLKTDEAKQLAKIILETPSDDWWFSEKEDDWWVNRGK
jgi:putative hydrolase of HD superfamily